MYPGWSSPYISRDCCLFAGLALKTIPASSSSEVACKGRFEGGGEHGRAGGGGEDGAEAPLLRAAVGSEVAAGRGAAGVVGVVRETTLRVFVCV